MAFTIENESAVADSNQAEVDSVDLDILVAGFSASGVVSGCAVTAQGSPDLTVAVASGVVIVGGTVVSVTGANATIGAADANNSRFDLITINNSGTIATTAGTAAAEPVFPAIPANSIVLAAVLVLAADTSIESDKITDKRVLIDAQVMSSGVTLLQSTADYSLVWADPAAARTLTIPAVAGNRSFSFINEAETLSAVKTFTAIPVFNSVSITLEQSTANYTLQWANPSTGRTLQIPAVGQTSTFDFLEQAATISAVKTFSAAPIFADDIPAFFGGDSDAAVVLNSAALSANEEVSGVIIGTSNHQATAVDSLIISNTKSGGDVLMLVTSGSGNTQEFLFVDGSAGQLVLGHAMSTVVVKTAVGAITLDPAANVVITNGQGLVIGHTGQLAIGSSATSELQILGTAAADSSIDVARFTNSAEPPRIVLSKSRGATIGALGIVSDNDELGEIEFVGDDGVDLLSVAASIMGRVNGTPGVGDMPGELVFSTTPDGAQLPTVTMILQSDKTALMFGDMTFQQASTISVTAGDLTFQVPDGQQFIFDSQATGTSNQVAKFIGNNKTGAVGDEAYISFMLDNDAGSSQEAGRITWEFNDPAAASKDGEFRFHVPVANSLTVIVAIDQNGVTMTDNFPLFLGGTRDGAFVLNSGGLSANDELTSVIVGTSVHQGTAINSLIMSNRTTDGDMLFLVSDNGNSLEFLKADGDVAALTLGHAMATVEIKTASGDITLSPAGFAVMVALAASAPAPDGTSVHIWRGDSSATAPDARTILHLEDDDHAIVTFSTPTDKTAGFYFADSGGATRGRLIYNHDGSPERFEFFIANASRLLYSAGAFAFQEATIISATGNLTLNPDDDVIMGADVFIEHDTNAGLTAGTTQTQAGGLALTTEINEVATVATTDDTVVLPLAAAGREVTIINNGANDLQIFPASGDNVGVGVDLATTLEINEVITFVAHDATNWNTESVTQIVHAEMTDNDNTDAFVIVEQDNEQAYHNNGLVAGDLGGGWTFDAGGAGTSFPIASIADGAASGVDIAVTTTGTHGLDVGDIISQSNLTSAVYTGHFKVKAIISTTIYEVAAVFTATDTGTMDQAAVLICPTGGTGTYKCDWGIDGSPAGNNDVFDFALHIDAAHQDKSNGRNRFGTAGDVDAVSRSCLLDIAEGDRISFMVKNTSGAGNFTIRHINVVLIRL